MKKMKASQRCTPVWYTVNLLFALQVCRRVNGEGLRCLTPQGNCACLTNRGLLDLSPLDSLNPNSPRFQDIAGTGGRDFFSYNPCTAFTSVYPCDNVAACQKRNDNGFYYYWPIGDQDQPLWIADEVTGNLMIQYSATSFGTLRISMITLKCDPNVEGTLLAFGEESPGDAIYLFELQTQYACLGGGRSGGLSPGSILLIIATVLLLVYLVGGIVFNSLQRGATGTDRLPHLQYWTAIPALVKDGVMFTIEKVRGTARPAEAYDSI